MRLVNYKNETIEVTKNVNYFRKHFQGYVSKPKNYEQNTYLTPVELVSDSEDTAYNGLVWFLSKLSL